MPSASKDLITFFYRQIIKLKEFQTAGKKIIQY